MCVISMIMDHYQDKYKEYPWVIHDTGTVFLNPPTRQEFDALRQDVLEMKELLKKAKIYDEKNNQPNCEDPKKVEFIRKLAKELGVELDI